MSPIVLFLLITLILLYIGYFFILPILSASNYNPDDDQNILSTDLYKKKLAELNAEFNAGTIEQNEFETAEKELKLQLLSDASVNPDKVYRSSEASKYRIALMLLIAVPSFVVAFYLWIGHPEALNQGVARNNPHGVASSPKTRLTKPVTQVSTSTTAKKTMKRAMPHLSSSNLAKLEEKLKKKPNDPTVQYTLARAYQQRRQYKKSAAMYKQLLSRIPKTHQRGASFANFLASYADVLASSLQGKLDGEPIQIVFQALKAYPNHGMSLHLAGTYYFRKNDYKAALKYWEKLHKLSAKRPQYAQQIMASINLAKQKLAGGSGIISATKLPTTTIKPTKTNNVPFSITGVISIDPALKFTPPANSYLFVFAKQPNGPPRPLAALKISSISYPYHFTLDNNNLLFKGGRSLKDMMPLVLTARITKTGNALDRAGSVTGSITVTNTAHKNVKIIINKK
ncbi:hypothetical protein MNBD_GAMMA12-2848 [hydrothermal vent metagenome]|uniref:Cytochrome c-type biogenesis protein H Ig-like domain-containing protein n=1 Tax=hydrothermal vent metagenome TaxID=652676 RepID=A0A3B0YWV5_9ZZZZ